MVKPAPGPDNLEKGLRLGCGALVGVLMFGPLAYRFFDGSAGTWWMLTAGVLVFALLALRHGDRFWAGLADWWRAWWPFAP